MELAESSFDTRRYAGRSEAAEMKGTDANLNLELWHSIISYNLDFEAAAFWPFGGQKKIRFAFLTWVATLALWKACKRYPCH
jgi:hypothetical protein